MVHVLCERSKGTNSMKFTWIMSPLSKHGLGMQMRRLFNSVHRISDMENSEIQKMKLDMRLFNLVILNYLGFVYTPNLAPDLRFLPKADWSYVKGRKWIWMNVSLRLWNIHTFILTFCSLWPTSEGGFRVQTFLYYKITFSQRDCFVNKV